MLKAIRNESDYETYLSRTFDLMQKTLKLNSVEANELEVLSILVKHYEDKKYPVPPPSPLVAIRFKLDQMGLSESDLSKLLCGRSRKSEIFSKKRNLSLSMIRKLNKTLRISADVLIQEI